LPISKANKDKYPKDWPAVRERILVRAGERCEFRCADGTRCGAPNWLRVARELENPEAWIAVREHDEQLGGYRAPVTIVLTIAHLNHDVRDCRDENLRAGCQLHHLRHDAAHHRANARRTIRRRRGELELFP
jgi:hypothetical protein